MIPNSPLAATILCRRPMLVQRARSFPCDSTNAEGLDRSLTWTDSLPSGKHRSLGAKSRKCARFYVLLRGKRRTVACAGQPPKETSCYYTENLNDLSSSNGLRSRTQKTPAVTRVFSVDEDTAGSRATFQVIVASGKRIMGVRLPRRQYSQNDSCANAANVRFANFINASRCLRTVDARPSDRSGERRRRQIAAFKRPDLGGSEH